MMYQPSVDRNMPLYSAMLTRLNGLWQSTDYYPEEKMVLYIDTLFVPSSENRQRDNGVDAESTNITNNFY